MFFGYSNEVAIGAPLLAVLGIASIFIAMTATTNSLLQAVGKVSLPVKLIVLGSIIKLGMNYILVGIPQLNIRAVPYSTLVCYVVITLMSLIALYQTVGSLELFSSFGKPFAGSDIVCSHCKRGAESAGWIYTIPLCSADFGGCQVRLFTFWPCFCCV